MALWIASALVLEATAASALTVVDPSERLVNSHFNVQDQLTGWTQPDLTDVTTSWDSRDAGGDPTSGSAHLRYTGSENGAYSFRDGLTQQVTVTGGTNYTLTANIYANSGRAAVFLSWFDANSTLIGDWVFPTQPFGDSEQKWISSETIQTAPTNAVRAEISLDVEATPGSDVYFDDVLLKEGTASAAAFSATPTVISRGQEATLSWATDAGTQVTITPDVGDVASTGSAVVKPADKTTYTLTATTSSKTYTSTVTVDVIVTPFVLVSSYPQGIVEPINQGGGKDQFVLSNLGGSASTVTLTTKDSFYDTNPSSITISAGSDQIFSITARALPAGKYDGTITIEGDGVLPSSGSIPVTVVSTATAAAPASVTAAETRIDLSSTGDGLEPGSATFANSGNSTVEGLATADRPWIVPEAGIIEIAPRSSRSVFFTIDPSLKPTSSGSETATLSLQFATASPGASAVTKGTTTTNQAASSTSVTHTTRTTSTVLGDLPATAPGEIAFLIPGLLHDSRFLTEIAALNRASSQGALDLSVYYTVPALAPGSAFLSSYPSISPASLLTLSDATKTVFNDNSRSSAIEVHSTQPANVAVSCKVLSITPSNVSGTPLPIFRNDRIGPRAILAGLRPDLGEVSIVVQLVSGLPTTITTEFVDANGATLASREDSLGARGVLELRDVAPAGAAVAIVKSAAGSIAARAITLNSTTGLVSDVIDWNVRNAARSDDAQVLPYVESRTAGATRRTTELVLFNAGVDEAAGTLTYYPAGTPRRRRAAAAQWLTSTEAAHEIVVTLKAREYRSYIDILKSFGINSDSTGSLTYTPIRGTVSITAFLNIENSAAHFRSSLPVGAANDVIRKSQAVAFGALEDTGRSPDLLRAGTFRSGFGVFEIGGQPVTVRATLEYTPASSGHTVQHQRRSRDYVISANSVLMIEDLTTDLIGAGRQSLKDIRNMELDLVVADGDGAVVPFVFAVENTSGTVFARTP